MSEYRISIENDRVDIEGIGNMYIVPVPESDLAALIALKFFPNERNIVVEFVGSSINVRIDNV